MDLKDLLSGDFKDIKVEWNEHTVMVTFDPSVYTPELEAKVTGEGSGSQQLVELLITLVRAWDITEDGQPFPVTAESMGTLPVAFLTAITVEIGKELAQDPLLRATSGEPS
jgi:hypothetical protein